MTTTSIEFTPTQRVLMRALVASGGYGTQSEVVRGAFDLFIEKAVPRGRLVSAAIWAYQHGEASLSKAAELARVPHEEMQRILVQDGVFNPGGSAKELEEEVEFLGRHAGKASAKVKPAPAAKTRAR